MDPEILYAFTVDDAEAVVGRGLTPSEISSLRRTLGPSLADYAGVLTEQQFADRTEDGT